MMPASQREYLPEVNANKKNIPLKREIALDLTCIKLAVLASILTGRSR
jgi:hypothetical protein